MRKKYAAAEHIEYCRLCGAEIVRLNYANGQPYYTDVVLGPRGQKQVVTGAGNNYNWKPAHDCVADAKRAWEDAVRSLEGATKEMESGRQSVEAYRTLKSKPMPVVADASLAQLMQSMLDSLPLMEAKLAEQEKVVAQYQAYVAESLRKYETRKAGLTTLPATTVQIGKNVKVVKGRKVPVGTVGRVFWMGDDKFTPGQVRVGLVTAEGAKHYTAETNVEVVL